MHKEQHSACGSVKGKINSPFNSVPGTVSSTFEYFLFKCVFHFVSIQLQVWKRDLPFVVIVNCCDQSTPKPSGTKQQPFIIAQGFVSQESGHTLTEVSWWHSAARRTAWGSKMAFLSGWHTGQGGWKFGLSWNSLSKCINVASSWWSQCSWTSDVADEGTQRGSPQTIVAAASLLRLAQNWNNIPSAIICWSG